MKQQMSTKLKLLQVLKNERTHTMREIMRHFSISEITVRKHMNVLLEEGFIDEEAVKQDIGRPYYVYTLTDKGNQTLPTHCDQLPIEFLQDVEAVHGKEAVNQVLHERMEQEMSLFKDAFDSGDFDEQMDHLTRVQDEKGYMVEFIKHEDGSYEMRNYHCPIIHISSEYKEVCVHEEHAYATLFPKSQVLAHSCITEGDHVCTWTFSKPNKSIS